MIVTARPLRSGRYTTIKWDRNVSEVFKALRSCGPAARTWQMHGKEDDGAVSLHFLFHRLCLMNDRVKGGSFIGLRLHLFLFVYVCVLQKRRPVLLFFFSHVISEAKVIYGCQEVPRSALMPEKTLTRVWWGMEGVERVSHPQNALMYFLCQRATGRSHPKSCCLTNKRISEVAWSTVLRARPQN